MCSARAMWSLICRKFARIRILGLPRATEPSMDMDMPLNGVSVIRTEAVVNATLRMRAWQLGM